MLLHTIHGGVFLQPRRKRAILDMRPPGPHIYFSPDSPFSDGDHCSVTAFTLFRRLVGGTLIASGLLLLPKAASAQTPTQREVFRLSPLGAYLAARHAGADRDAAAAAAYYRAALRADPNNKELLDRAFLALLASGEVEESVKLAERIVQTDKTDRIARLALGVRAIKQKQYQTARQHLSQSVRGPITDLAATLLSGWASFGLNEARAAVDNIDKLSGPDW